MDTSSRQPIISPYNPPHSLFPPLLTGYRDPWGVESPHGGVWVPEWHNLQHSPPVTSLGLWCEQEKILYYKSLKVCYTVLACLPWLIQRNSVMVWWTKLKEGRLNIKCIYPVPFHWSRQASRPLHDQTIPEAKPSALFPLPYLADHTYSV